MNSESACTFNITFSDGRNISLKNLAGKTINITFEKSQNAESFNLTIEDKEGNRLENEVANVGEAQEDHNIQIESSPENNAEVMQIFIEHPYGKMITLDCDPFDTIQKIKKMIHEKEEISLSEQNLVFEGKQLEDGQTLSDYNIVHKTTIQLKIGYHENNETFVEMPDVNESEFADEIQSFDETPRNEEQLTNDGTSNEQKPQLVTVNSPEVSSSVALETAPVKLENQNQSDVNQLLQDVEPDIICVKVVKNSKPIRVSSLETASFPKVEPEVQNQAEVNSLIQEVEPDLKPPEVSSSVDLESAVLPPVEPEIQNQIDVDSLFQDVEPDVKPSEESSSVAIETAVLPQAELGVENRIDVNPLLQDDEYDVNSQEVSSSAALETAVLLPINPEVQDQIDIDPLLQDVEPDIICVKVVTNVKRRRGQKRAAKKSVISKEVKMECAKRACLTSIIRKYTRP